MRVWDLPVELLCDKHLIAQHHEIHCIYNIITKGTKAWSNHPEVKRWVGHLDLLWIKHRETTLEMEYRGFNHKTPLKIAFPHTREPLTQWQSTREQIQLLRGKGCRCLR